MSCSRLVLNVIVLKPNNYEVVSEVSSRLVLNLIVLKQV